jgi:hypothetical protein
MSAKYNNSGTLGRNQYKQMDNQPEYTGKATIDGVEYRLAAWVKDGQDGKFFAIKFTQKDAQLKPAAQETAGTIDDDIPF